MESEGLLMPGVSTGSRRTFVPEPGFSLQNGLAREVGVLGACFRRKGERAIADQAIATCLPSGSEASTHATGPQEGVSSAPERCLAMVPGVYVIGEGWPQARDIIGASSALAPECLLPADRDGHRACLAPLSLTVAVGGR